MHFDLTNRKIEETADVYDIKLKTRSSNNLVLWRSKSEDVKTEYFAVVLADGYLEVSWYVQNQKDSLAIR